MEARSRVDLMLAAIGVTPVARLLVGRSAVVLERLARGGGATRWYFIAGETELPALAAALAPGSAVSFYFDGRSRRCRLGDDAVDLILDLVHAHGEAVVGMLTSDGVEIDVEFVCGVGDLSEMLGSVADGTELFVGVFPERDDNGVDAVTFDLPDSDGVVRQHPH